MSKLVKKIVIDSRVFSILDDKHASGECKLKCLKKLEEILKDNCCLVLDNSLQITQEYKAACGHIGEKLFKNLSRKKNSVPITDHPSYRQYVEFPDDIRLFNFFPRQCKFVAVARATNEAKPLPIYTISGLSNTTHTDILKIYYNIPIHILC